MKNSFVKTSAVHTIDTIDMETGEIVDTITNKSTYLANSKEEFYLMYSSMVLILKGSTDVRMKLFAALLERNASGMEFAMNKSLKEVIALECGCKPRSFDSAFTSLVKDNIIVRVRPHLYKINPRHVFKGHSAARNNSLKAIIELGCKDC
jgi:hypothetical protein